mmetsp:Transcript_3632/g.13391  ORF Transcript_3632/g.13391 Transcript_3632/m.13391 type:complete len:233 (-) Transcript_3632:4882-5580(-)
MSHFKPVSNTNRSTVCIMCTHKYTNTNSSRYRHSAISVQKLFPKSQVMTATTYQETQIGTTPYAVLSAMNDENKTGMSCHGGRKYVAWFWYTARPNGFASRIVFVSWFIFSGFCPGSNITAAPFRLPTQMLPTPNFVLRPATDPLPRHASSSNVAPAYNTHRSLTFPPAPMRTCIAPAPSPGKTSDRLPHTTSSPTSRRSNIPSATSTPDPGQNTLFPILAPSARYTMDVYS